MANSGPIEFHVEDLKRVTRFYEAVFGWDILDSDEDGDKQPISASNFMLPANNGFISGPIETTGITLKGVLFTMEVASIPETLSRVALWEGQIILTDVVAPGEGLMAYCKDTEGNLFGIIQSGPSAGR
jgi:predicted enzyme related to lactoylglutathione lyase